MPWTEIWSEGFLQDPRSYSRFQHCLTNIGAKLGSLFQRVEMSDHYGSEYKLGLDRDKDGTALALIIMSAMKAANVYPGGVINLSEYIEADLMRRNAGKD
jgi:hypothetical protein